MRRKTNKQTPDRKVGRGAPLCLLGLLVSVALPLMGSPALGQVGSDAASTGNSPRPGYLIQVPLPITESVAAQVKQQLNRVADEAPVLVKSEERPVLILEFDTSNASTGIGSELGSCLNLALRLTDSSLSHLHIVAYVPRPRGFSESSDEQALGSRLRGHAVLAALACNELAMHQESSIGDAGADLDADPVLAAQLYENITGKRLVLPVPMALAMVDPSRALYRVETAEGAQVVDDSVRDQLQRSGKVISTETLNEHGVPATFTSQSLLRFRLIRHRVSSRRDLARRLNLDPSGVEGDPSAGGRWDAVQLPLDSFIDQRSASWALRMLNKHLMANSTNLIIVRIGAEDGELEACLQLARDLAALDPSKHRTVAYVPAEARGPSSLVALACDQLVMSPTGMLGGPGHVPLSDEQIQDARPAIMKIVEEKQKDWSIPLGLIDASLSIERYSNKRTGQMRLLSAEEHSLLPDKEDWQASGAEDFSSGISGTRAEQLMLARTLVEDFGELKSFYQLTETPLELEPSLTDRWIETLARELAQPWIAAWLLFGAVFLLSTEMSHPGIGIPGFLGTICLLLFFWSQYLDGNAHWLEILLFGVGVTFVILELFVIPGFGVFGIGGLVMIVVSIVLATQTFVFPRTSEEMAQLPGSLSIVLAGGGGFVAALIVIRRFLPSMPLFRRLMLEPPGSDAVDIAKNLASSSSGLSELVGRRGTSVTPLVPAGKARLAGNVLDVITDGRPVEKGMHIEVLEVTGNRILVRPIEDASS